MHDNGQLCSRRVYPCKALEIVHTLKIKLLARRSAEAGAEMMETLQKLEDLIPLASAFREIRNEIDPPLSDMIAQG